ncbi:MAG TPA: carbohydrate binding domain-containing protein, partial [Polyangiaceae bacterium]|nr:carbohydrate binding domain-containing protein [Polyangiaceae bacterium]
ASEPAKITAQVICSGEDPVYVPVGEAVATDTGWVNVVGEIDVPDCSLDALNLYVEGPAAGVDLYVDDLTLREQDSGLGPELLQNTTFENNLDWWFPWGAASAEHSSAAAHSGLGSAYVSSRENNFDGLATNLLDSVEPGVTYQASGWVLLDGAATGEAVLTAAVQCAGESMQFLRIGRAAASDTAWTLITGSVEVPDCTLEQFFFYVEGLAPGVNFYFDDPSFRAALSNNEGPNVLRNSTFDSSAGGTAWWFGWGPTVVGVSTTAHSGDQSAIGTGRTGSWNGIAYDIMNNTSEPLVAGGSYALDAWVRINGAATDTVNFTTQHACAEGGGDQYTWIGGTTATDTGWAQITGGLTVPASTCTLTKYFLYAEGAAAGVDILIDDVYLTQQL